MHEYRYMQGLSDIIHEFQYKIREYISFLSIFLDNLSIFHRLFLFFFKLQLKLKYRYIYDYQYFHN